MVASFPDVFHIRRRCVVARKWDFGELLKTTLEMAGRKENCPLNVTHTLTRSTSVGDGGS